MSLPEADDDRRRAAMRRALELAARCVEERGGGPFGAVVLKDGEVLAEGQNLVTVSGDPTAHAEIVAIRRACERLGSFSLEGCELLSSCEPCPMCLGAIEWARLDRLYFAAGRDDAARAGFDDARYYEELATPYGARELPTGRLLADQGWAPFAAWLAKDDRTPY